MLSKASKIIDTITDALTPEVVKVFKTLEESDLEAYFSRFEEHGTFKRCLNCDSVLRHERTSCWVCRSLFNKWKSGGNDDKKLKLAGTEVGSSKNRSNNRREMLAGDQKAQRRSLQNKQAGISSKDQANESSKAGTSRKRGRPKKEMESLTSLPFKFGS